MEGLVLRRGGYERYGLTGNPFRDLSSDSIENVDIFHVRQSIDDTITSIIEESVARESKATVAILGSMGSGKTMRLLLAKNLADREGFFCVFQNMNTLGSWITKGMARGVLEKTDLGTMSRIFSAPKWYKTLAAMEKAEDTYDANSVGKAMAEALNANIPAFLLMNDIHNMSAGKDVKTFIKMFHVMLDNIEPGVVVLITSDEAYFEDLMAANPSLSQRINRKLLVPKFQVHEASLLLAKRMLVKRLVEDMDPVYPFTESAIAMMNAMGEGNPRMLIRYADITIDQASIRKVMRIDENFIAEVASFSEAKPQPDTKPSKETKFTQEEKEEMLKKSYLQGSITKEEYISNLRKLREKDKISQARDGKTKKPNQPSGGKE